MVHEEQIERWTRARVTGVFEAALQLIGARGNVDVPTLARLMDRLFSNLLGEAPRLPAVGLEALLESTTDLLYHALFLPNRPDPERKPNEFSMTSSPAPSHKQSVDRSSLTAKWRVEGQQRRRMQAPEDNSPLADKAGHI